MYRLLPFLALVFLLLSAGCTNVAGDRVRSLTSDAGTTALLMQYADTFFTAAGYDCQAEDRGAALRCGRELRDLFIHQTRAVVEIFEDKDADRYLLASTRWDEGLIPGEFISSKFENPDVATFCESLAASGKGKCQVEE